MMASGKNMERMPMMYNKTEPGLLAEIKLEAKKRFYNPRYMELLLPNFTRALCRLREWPDAVNRALNK
jgi:proline iminopeptidase